MLISNFKLIEKRLLTNNIFELHFKSNIKSTPKAGQFITFLLPITKFGRAYSIVESNGEEYIFLIKKLENGRGGSKEICNINQGELIKGIGPTGHFLLNSNNNSQLYIGTGVGFAPLYNMINESLINNNNKEKIKLIFGVRFNNDIFYINELNKLKEKFSNFNYEIYISREDIKGYKNGYVTNYITSDNIKNYEEFYICGNPNVINSTKSKLIHLGILNKNIFYEKY